MAQMGRPGLSAEQKRELWRRWKEGQSLSEIGRALERHAGSIFGVIKDKGGFAPRERRRASSALTLAEREEISRGVAGGRSIRSMAATLRRAPSTISREINRNGGLRHYRAARAEQAAWDRARRPKRCLLARNTRLRDVVAAKLAEDWSPEQIAGWLHVEYADDDTMRVSHETIYRSLFIQARGVLKKELLAHLRSGRVMRRAKSSTRCGQGRARITDALSIRERPPEAEDRAVPGHWEGDLLAGSGNTHIATLVERRSRFVMLVKVAGKDTETVVAALSRQVGTLPVQLRGTVTWDRGMEMAAHKQFSVATGIAVYFCEPKSPWQRGSNENTNGLLRQYFPKKTDVSVYNQEELDAIAARLNRRPRKTLGYRTPAAMLLDVVAPTG